VSGETAFSKVPGEERAVDLPLFALLD